jgi:inosose dehydratase
MAKLAAAPITWGVCELRNWGDVPPYHRVLDEIAATGYAGTELGPEGYLPGDPRALERELAARGLALVGAFCPITLHRAEEAPDSLDRAVVLAGFLAEVGCPFLIAADAGSDARRAIAGRVPREAMLPGDAWQRFGEGLAELGRRCAPLGVHVVFHPHAGTHVETPAEIDALFAQVPEDAAGMCLDTGHVAYGGGDPGDLCRRYVGRVWHVHAKDVRPDVIQRVRREGIAYEVAVGQGVFAPLGEGMVDFPALVETLQQAGYDGWYVVEQDVRLGPPWPAQDPVANARHSATYLSGLLASNS